MTSEMCWCGRGVITSAFLAVKGAVIMWRTGSENMWTYQQWKEATYATTSFCTK